MARGMMTFVLPVSCRNRDPLPTGPGCVMLGATAARAGGADARIGKGRSQSAQASLSGADNGQAIAVPVIVGDSCGSGAAAVREACRRTRPFRSRLQ